MSLLERLDELAKHYDRQWMGDRRSIDNETRQALQDAAVALRTCHDERVLRTRYDKRVFTNAIAGECAARGVSSV